MSPGNETKYISMPPFIIIMTMYKPNCKLSCNNFMQRSVKCKHSQASSKSCLNGEFWLGLEAIHRLAPTQWDRSVTTLRNDLRDSQGNPGNAIFETFGLLNSDTQYELSISHYSGGNAGDSLTQHTGSRFFTRDYDVGHPAFGADCANQAHGAWWFLNVRSAHDMCNQFGSHLNGLYTPVNGDQRSGIQWRSFTGGSEALSFSEMKLRRRIQ